MRHAADVEGCAEINAGLKRLLRCCESPDYVAVAGIPSPSSFLLFGFLQCGLVVLVNGSLPQVSAVFPGFPVTPCSEVQTTV